MAYIERWSFFGI